MKGKTALKSVKDEAASGDVEKSEPVPTTVLTEATMLGELVKCVVDEIRAAPDVWAKLSEAKQDAVIQRVTDRCKDLVKQAVSLIAADGREVITAALEQITAKDSIKAVCTLTRHNVNRHSLLDAVGRPVLIVVSDASQFFGGDIPKADRDQPELLGDADGGDGTPVADNTTAAAVH